MSQCHGYGHGHGTGAQLFLSAIASRSASLRRSSCRRLDPELTGLEYSSLSPHRSSSCPSAGLRAYALRLCDARRDHTCTRNNFGSHLSPDQNMPAISPRSPCSETILYHTGERLACSATPRLRPRLLPSADSRTERTKAGFTLAVHAAGCASGHTRAAAAGSAGPD